MFILWSKLKNVRLFVFSTLIRLHSIIRNVKTRAQICTHTQTQIKIVCLGGHIAYTELGGKSFDCAQYVHNNFTRFLQKFRFKKRSQNLKIHIFGGHHLLYYVDIFLKN